MGMKSVGAYLKTLREQKGLSQKYIALELMVSEKQVSRWENGLSEPSSSSLATFIHVVGGSSEHVTQLILDEKATIEEAEILVKGVLKEQLETPKRELVLDNRNVVEAMELVMNLRHTPIRLAQWVEQGKRLVEKG